MNSIKNKLKENFIKKKIFNSKSYVLDLENAFGRERENNKIYWGPRVLDIDFISWGELQVKTESLVLPHPRFAERNFVLIPLAEILSNTQGKPRQIKFQENWPE